MENAVTLPPAFDTAQLFTASAKRDPYPVYRLIRETGAIHRADLFGDTPSWLMGRYEDVRNVLLDSDAFSSQLHGAASLPYMITQDPPSHDRLRRMVQRAFTSATIRAQAPRIECLAHRFLAQALDRETCDWIDTFANPLPALVIGHLLGIRDGDMELMRGWADEALHIGMEQTTVDGIPPGAQDMLRYLLTQIRSRDSRGGDTVFAGLGRLHDEGSLDEAEILLFCALLVVAGHATTTHLIGNGTYLLAQRPNLWRKLKDNPGLLPRFVEEVLRYESPLQLRIRRCRRPVRICAAKVGAGDFVALLLGAANRDPSRFAAGDDFSLEHDSTGHLAFGHGIHGCLGAALARLEGSIVFRVMLEELDRIEMPGHPTWLADEIALAWRGFRTLPLRFRGR